VKIARRLTLLLGAAMGVLSSAAMAYSPILTASAGCTEGVKVINYTVNSWTQDIRGENPLVEIWMPNSDGIFAAVDEGAFVAPTYSFSGTVPAPEGTTADIVAWVEGDWGDGTDGGVYDRIQIALPADCPPPPPPPVNILNGRFTGGGAQLAAAGASKITLGLTLHCDLMLSNNLQVNWGKNRFHMEEHLVTMECSDDPAIGQAPPVAPLDTMRGMGRGRFNGKDGYTIEFTLVDGGEPSGDDRAALRIYETANPANVVLNAPLQSVNGGNLQAHADQPHK
jgi:hypothetical protein